MAHLGPLVVRTGQFTGRSPNDKFIVEEPSSRDKIWWGDVNSPIDEERFQELHRRMAAYLQGKDVFVQDCFCGADPEYRMPIRIITQYAWHSLFARNMFIQATPDELANHQPEWVEPLKVDLGDFSLYEIPPNSHAIAALLALGILRYTDVPKLDPDSAESVDIQARAMAAAIRVVQAEVADPAWMRLEPAALLDEQWFADRASEIARKTSVPQHGVHEGPEPDTVFMTAADASGMGCLYAQNHHGVYRSDDGGLSWTSIADGLPSDFGFVMLAHPTVPGTAWVVPLVADRERVPPEGRLRLHRTRDGGRTWSEVGAGLPDGAWTAVLRDAACVVPVGGDGGSLLAFGTRDGCVYVSTDDGETVELVASHLPDVLCVRALAG